MKGRAQCLAGQDLQQKPCPRAWAVGGTSVCTGWQGMQRPMSARGTLLPTLQVPCHVPISGGQVEEMVVVCVGFGLVFLRQKKLLA